jgi:hypothetical protein
VFARDPLNPCTCAERAAEQLVSHDNVVASQLWLEEQPTVAPPPEPVQDQV